LVRNKPDLIVVANIEGAVMSDLPEPPVVPTVKVDWYRSLTGWYPLMRTLPLAWRSTWLIPALIGFYLTAHAWQLASFIFSEPIQGWGPMGLPSPRTFNFFQSGYLGIWLQWLMPFASTPDTATAAESLWSWQQAATITLGSVISLLIWSAIGGWITRRSVVELATRSTEDWGTTLKLIRARWFSFVLALTSPLMIVIALLAIVWSIGLLGRLGTPGFWISSLLMIPVLLFLFPITRVLINWAGGLPLIFAGVATEKNADGFEGFSRGFAYISQAPVPMILGVLAVQAISVAGETIIFYGFSVAWDFFAGAYFWGFGQANTSQQFADKYPIWADFGATLPYALSRAFSYSYFFTASAALYLILRQTVDQTDIDNIDLQETTAAKPLPEIPQSPPPSPTEG
jgi:hypothetical protein